MKKFVMSLLVGMLLLGAVGGAFADPGIGLPQLDKYPPAKDTWWYDYFLECGYSPQQAEYFAAGYAGVHADCYPKKWWQFWK